MAFRNRRAILGPLTLPIGDKTYVIQPLPANIGIRLRLVAEGADDPEITEMIKDHPSEVALFLGDALAEMQAADDVYPDDIEAAFTAAYADFRRGRAAAERAWELGYDPELLAALMAATVEASSSPDSPPSPSSAKAPKTPTAGTRSTTSRLATPRAARKPSKASPSGGRRSSSKGSA